MEEEKRLTEYEKFMEKLNVTQVQLSDTSELMCSKDYKDRFIAEYYQLKIRFDKLNDMLIKMKAGTLEFTPICTEGTFEDQLYYMNEYLKILRIRAEIEGIDLVKQPGVVDEGIPIEEAIGEEVEEPKQENPVEETPAVEDVTDSNFGGIREE